MAFPRPGDGGGVRLRLRLHDAVDRADGDRMGVGGRVFFCTGSVRSGLLFLLGRKYWFGYCDCINSLWPVFALWVSVGSQGMYFVCGIISVCTRVCGSVSFPIYLLRQASELSM